MQKVKNTTIPRVFLSAFKEIERKYPTRFSKFSFKQPPVLLNYDKFSIASLGPKLWNKILSEKKTSEKNISSLLIIKAQIKEKLLSVDS